VKEPSAPRPASDVLAAVFATAAGCATYAALMHWGAPGLWYLPLGRAWTFGHKPAALAMSWYGRTVYVFAAALLGGAVGRAIPRPSPRLTKVSALVAGASLIVAVSVCVASNVNRPTKPLPLPDGRPVVCAPTP
jgi:hypothetical protein